MDVVIIFGFISHLDLIWNNPTFSRWIERLNKFARVIIFDKRGVGLSDRVDRLPTLEERMDDVRAVMDAAGSTKACLIGLSEGVPLALLFAATHPERATALALYGGMARSTADVDYPYATPIEGLRDSVEQFMRPDWGTGASIEVFAPSYADNLQAREFYAMFERQAVSPRAMDQLVEMFLDTDVRDILPSVHVPALILHRKGDRVVNVRAGRWLAEHLPGAKFVELEGIDHSPMAGDAERLLDEVEEFFTGVRPTRELDRALATVLFTDIVDSTKRAAEVGDTQWRVLLENHDKVMRKHIEQAGGKEVKTTGDGFLATFDGPARAIRCALGAIAEIGTHGIQIRSGLHTGEVEIMGDDIGGIAVHIAARVGALSGPGEVLVSRTIKDLVAGSGINFEEKGEYELKGVPDRWQLYSVVTNR